MWRRIGLLAGVLLLICAAGVAAQGESNAERLRAALTAPGCEAACFFGIEPGVTPIEEVETLLQAANLGYRHHPLVPPSAESEPDIWAYGLSPEDNTVELFPFLGQWGYVTIVYDIYNPFINSIGIISLKELTIEDILQAFGPPDYLRVFAPNSVEYYLLGYPIDNYMVYRAEHHLYVRVIAELGEAEDIFEIHLLSPATLDFMFFGNERSVDLQPCTEPKPLCNIVTAPPASE